MNFVNFLHFVLTTFGIPFLVEYIATRAEARVVLTLLCARRRVLEVQFYTSLVLRIAINNFGIKEIRIDLRD